MSDIGTRYTDSRQRAIEQRMHTIYRAAQAEIIEQLDAHTKRQNAQTRVKLAQVKAGKLSEEEFNKKNALFVVQLKRNSQHRNRILAICFVVEYLYFLSNIDANIKFQLTHI